MVDEPAVDEAVMTYEAMVEKVAKTDITSHVDIVTDGSANLAVTMPSGWNAGLKERDDDEVTEAELILPNEEGEVWALRMAKVAILDLTSSMGIQRDYVCKTPASLMVPHVQYWLEHQEKRHRVLVQGDTGLALCRQMKTVPFPSLPLLAKAREAMVDATGAEPLVLRRMAADINRVAVRLLSPEPVVVIGDEEWGIGIQLTTSVTGVTPLTVGGLLHAPGRGVVLSKLMPPHKFRQTTKTDLIDAEDWVRLQVEGALHSLEDGHELAQLEHLLDLPVSDLSTLIADVFEQEKIPLPAREKIVSGLLDLDEEVSAYEVVAAVSRAAVEPGLEDSARESLMRASGHLLHQLGARCASCHRLPVV